MQFQLSENKNIPYILFVYFLIAGLFFPNITSAQKALSLPFFDDFSQTKGSEPSSHFWENSANIYINNTYSNTQPSLNIATFDGVDKNGTPYDFLNETARGYSDTLTSKSIDLSSYTARDSLILSFHWLARGLGNLPNLNDFLEVEFKDNKGIWTSVWKQIGEVYMDNFEVAFIKVTNPIYFHNQFQFRFRTFGTLSGAFDTWHLDYIYLDKNRNSNTKVLQDVAVRTPLTSLLKRYTAMPLKQFKNHTSKELSTSIQTEIINHLNSFNVTTYHFLIKDTFKNQVIYQKTDLNSAYIGALSSQVKTIPITPFSVSGNQKGLTLYSEFQLRTTDDDTSNNYPRIPGVNLKQNDTIYSTTDLADYFAYDDGSAEFGIRMQSRLGKVAVRFIANETDTLSGVRLAIVPFLKNLTGQVFTVHVWGSQNGLPSTPLYQKSFSVKYPETRNSFIDFTFDKGVAVKDTFYVGWTQLHEDYLTIGLDRNSLLGSDQVYTITSGNWEKTTIKGSIMIRPVNGGKIDKEIITGAQEIENPISIYPNPTRSDITFDSNQITQIDVYDLLGILQKRFYFQKNSPRSISLNELNEGVYLVQFYSPTKIETRKIIKQN